jgi:hypothetical protein
MAKKAEAAAVAAEVVEEKKERFIPTNSPLPSVQPIGEDEIGAPDIAKMLRVDPREFRNFLRASKRDMTTQKGTRYAWKKSDKEGIKAVAAEFKAWAAAKAAAKADKPVRTKKADKPAEETVDTSIDVEDAVEVTEADEISIDDLGDL